MAGRPHVATKYKDAYAPSGYDLLSILVCCYWQVNILVLLMAS